MAIHRLSRFHADDPLRGLVEAQDAALDIRGRQAARQAADHVLAEGLQILQLVRRLLERCPSATQPLGQPATERRDREEAEDVQADDEKRDALLRPRVGANHDRQRRRAEVLRRRQSCVDDRAQHPDQHAGALRLNRARGNDRERVERREVARDAARQVDERRNDNRVAHQLDVNQPTVLLRVPEQQHVDDRQRVREADQEKERIDRQRSRRLNLNQNRRAEQQRDDRSAAANQPQQAAAEIG